MLSEERVAVITGGAGAIGSATARALASSGYRAVTLDRQGGDVTADLASEAETKRAAAEILEQYGRVDALVHSAAIVDPVTLAEADGARWRTVFAVNVESALWLAQAFTPGMMERKFGRIVFIASDTVWSPPGPQFLSYVASKGALLGLMRTLAVSLGGDGISVSAVAPGLTDTPISRRVNDTATIAAVVAAQAMKRSLTPEDTANAIAFLAAEKAEALTGQVLAVNGGFVMR